MSSAYLGSLVALLVLTSEPSVKNMPYAIPMKNSGEVIHAFVADEEWNRTRMMIELDEPWLDSSERVVYIWRDDVGDDYYREKEWERTQRIKKGWADHEGVYVQTAAGMDWVIRSEWELAQRARKLSGVGSGPEAAPAAGTENAARSVEVGFWQAWGRHIAVMALGMALGLFVLKTLPFR